MRCETLKYFQDELETAMIALRSIKGPIGLREINVLTVRIELAHAALVKHRSTCLICANAPIEGYVMQS
jgi:hypothetical protein